MNIRLKIGIAGLMAFGVLYVFSIAVLTEVPLMFGSATIAAIVKTVELKNLIASDFTWSSVNLVYWFTTENYTIIIAACIPTLRPLFEKWFRKPSTNRPNHLSKSGGEKARLESNDTGASIDRRSYGCRIDITDV